MPTEIPEKIVSILRDIEELGSQEPTRLVVLKKWFQVPSRLRFFGVFIAQRASCRGGKGKAGEKELFILTKTLLRGIDVYKPSIDKRKARKLCSQLHEFQNDHKRTGWAVVRIIKNWNLFLVEQGLKLFLGDNMDAAAGYKVASDYCKYYDSLYGHTLNAGSTDKLQEIIHFMLTVESREGLQT